MLETMSKFHAVIYRNGHEYYIKDCNSSNRTFVNIKLVEIYEVVGPDGRFIQNGKKQSEHSGDSIDSDDTASPGERLTSGDRITLGKCFLTFRTRLLSPESDLVATVKLQLAFDASLEAKAVKFLDSVDADDEESADAILPSLASSSDNYSTNFPGYHHSSDEDSLVSNMIGSCSTRVLYTLLKADLLPQLIVTLNPLSQSFAEEADIHINIMNIITRSFWLATPDIFTCLEIEDGDEQQTVYETVLKQVLVPSEKYISHLCVNRFSIVDGTLSRDFLDFLARLLQISSYYQPMMDFVLLMPLFFTIPSRLTFFEDDWSIRLLFEHIRYSLEQWNKEGGDFRRSGTTFIRSLRMEGVDDVMEQQLQNDETERQGQEIVNYSIMLNVSLGINLLERA
ncbi:hypothetical protein BLNAU_5366 [Blattamonas nauphoetae]|uniref:FHA domain-containing protein n=1 Tax=Blattamonas nauphoetae TaxID=2049346 RepID=A0ABQ9Y7B3_9EUKA|nr:hypothetical protein BLNAU_5366 [Blattamonas nauphoetae]